MPAARGNRLDRRPIIAGDREGDRLATIFRLRPLPLAKRGSLCISMAGSDYAMRTLPAALTPLGWEQAKFRIFMRDVENAGL